MKIERRYECDKNVSQMSPKSMVIKTKTEYARNNHDGKQIRKEF